MAETVLEAVQAGFARSDRLFWLDGGGARDWSGTRSLVGVLDDDDVSLSFDATRQEVTRHQAGRQEVVGTDVFAVLEAEIARDAGDPDVHWVGCFGYASRPDLPAHRWGQGPDAIWMRSRDVSLLRPRALHRRSGFDELNRRWGFDKLNRRSVTAVVRRRVRAGAGAAARRELLRGQPDLPRGARGGGRPARDVPPAAGQQPRAVRRAAATSGHAPAEQLAGALRDDRPRPLAGDQADQGHHAAGSDRAGGRATARQPRRGRTVPRREPDDRRPAAQRPVDGLRGRQL